MSASRHPSALALDAHAVGDGAADTAAHLASCPECAAYVASLRDDAALFAARPIPAFLASLDATVPADVSPPRAIPSAEETNASTRAPTDPTTREHDAPRALDEDTPSRGPDPTIDRARLSSSEPVPVPADTTHATPKEERRDDPRPPRVLGPAAPRSLGRLRTAVYGTIPLAIAAAAFFVLRPDPTSDPTAPTAGAEATFRLKGPPLLAVVREREGAQTRFTGTVAVAPNDRLRLELTVDRPGTYESGLLGEDGSWIVLLAPTMLDPGAHFSERAARIDDHPSPGWLLAGSPADVARARATRDFSGLAIVPVQITKQP